MSNYFDQPIFVTGCPRSGVSMTAGVLEACGAFTGGVEFLPQAKKPTYENMAIRDDILIPYLKPMGVDEQGQQGIWNFTRKPVEDLPALPFVREKIRVLLKEQGYREDRRWLLKDWRLLPMQHLFLEAFPNATWVIARRTDFAIIRSCLMSGHMNAYSSTGAWKVWLGWYLSLIKKLESRTETLPVWPAQYVHGRWGEIRSTIQQLGLTWNLEAIQGTIHPGEWRQ